MSTMALEDIRLGKRRGSWLKLRVWSLRVLAKEPATPSSIELTADSLMASIPIWTWETSIEVLVHIACRYQRRELYRGFHLCSNTDGHTFLLDMTGYVHVVKDATKKLLQFDAIEQAKLFVDALQEALQ